MIKTSLPVLAILLFTLTACNSPAKKAAPSWKNLFNGKDLSGWHVLNGKATYRVEDSTIVGTTAWDTPNTFLATDSSYDNFILELEVKVDTLLNSGIQFRSLSNDYQHGRVHGYQAEIDPSDRAWSGGIYDEARRGWLYNLDSLPKAQQAFRKNDWNNYHIEAVGDTLKIYVNKVQTSYLLDSLTHSGFIALQVHAIGDSTQLGREIKWRHIRIMEDPRPADLWKVDPELPLRDARH